MLNMRLKLNPDDTAFVRPTTERALAILAEAVSSAVSEEYSKRNPELLRICREYTSGRGCVLLSWTTVADRDIVQLLTTIQLGQDEKPYLAISDRETVERFLAVMSRLVNDDEKIDLFAHVYARGKWPVIITWQVEPAFKIIKGD